MWGVFIYWFFKDNVLCLQTFINSCSTVRINDSNGSFGTEMLQFQLHFSFSVSIVFLTGSKMLPDENFMPF